jgi:hypothetical protein
VKGQLLLQIIQAQAEVVIEVAEVEEGNKPTQSLRTSEMLEV